MTVAKPFAIPTKPPSDEVAIADLPTPLPSQPPRVSSTPPVAPRSAPPEEEDDGYVMPIVAASGAGAAVWPDGDIADGA